MKRFRINIKTKNKNYPIIIGENILDKTGNLINTQIPSCKKIALIIDSKVPKKILVKVKNSIKNFDNLYIKLNTSEKIKDFKTVSELINKLLKKKFHRNDCLIALGGGILGDIAGLTASLVKRGIKFINIPTTLLSQVDSSIGGKTGVNSGYGKNLIGSFYQPEMVISDTSALNSLPKREVTSGYAEILKHALILDKKLFYWLQRNGRKILNLNNKIVIQKAIYESCKIKAKIIEKDEKEKDLRMILNFGHTFGHAFEATTNFSNKINHGGNSAPLYYKGFPKSCCTSTNHIVCHGIPSEKVLKDGDIMNVDVTAFVDEHHGDTGRMFCIGDVSVKSKNLISTTYESMMRAISIIKPGTKLGDIGATIQDYVESKGFSVVRDFCGHGIGTIFHKPPNVLHYGKKNSGISLECGMIFTIEPMINEGKYEIKILNDGWTAVTKDKTLSAQFEHTVGVTDKGFEIFTKSDKNFTQPPYLS